MKNYRDKRIEAEFFSQVTRTHPWTTALSDESHRYYNLIEKPELIETSLEDFLPYNNYPAIQTFYELLKWLNGSDSIFESNDSALSNKIEINTDRNTPQIAQQSHRIRGRLFFFFREHILNADQRACNWLLNDIPLEFGKIDNKFELGIVGYSIAPTAYLSLPAPLSERSYPSICLSFFAWGTDENSTMENLQRLFSNTLKVLKILSEKGITRKYPQRGQKLMQKVLDNDTETLNKLTTVRWS